MYRFLEQFIRYNANVSGKQIGDCQRRALAFAYGLPYSKVMEMLKSRGRYNSKNAVIGTIMQLGVKDVKYFDVPNYQKPTVEQFCNAMTDNVWLLLVEHEKDRRKKTGANHVVCCAGGNWYDTWDSGQCKVYVAYKTTTDPDQLLKSTRTVEDATRLANSAVDYLKDKLSPIADSFVSIRGEKLVTISVVIGVHEKTHEPFIFENEFHIYIIVNEKMTGTKFSEKIVFSLSPSWDEQQTDKYILDQCNKYIKKVDKKLNDLLTLANTTGITDNETSEYLDPDAQVTFRSWNNREQVLFNKLPMWARKYVYQINLGRYPYSKYTLFVKKRPGIDAGNFTIRGDSLEELYERLDEYRAGKDKSYITRLKFI